LIDAATTVTSPAAGPLTLGCDFADHSDNDATDDARDQASAQLRTRCHAIATALGFGTAVQWCFLPPPWQSVSSPPCGQSPTFCGLSWSAYSFPGYCCERYAMKT